MILHLENKILPGFVLFLFSFFNLEENRGCLLMALSAWSLGLFLLSHSINKLDGCQGKCNLGHDS